MHVITPNGVSRPHKLIGINYQGVPAYELNYPSLAALAEAAKWNEYTVACNRESWMPLERQAVREIAVNPRGKTLPIAELVAWSRRISQENNRGWYGVFVFRRGSVSGVSSGRGGRHWTTKKVQNERRGNGLVMREDGEVAARAVRQGRYLPDSWDGRRRIQQRSWKSQHNGRKSWERPVRHGERQDA